MTLVQVVAIGISLSLPASFLGVQTNTPTDVWQPLNFFLGKWEGTGTGSPGVSKIQREYRLTLNDRFLHVQNRSTYEPQPKIQR